MYVSLSLYIYIYIYMYVYECTNYDVPGVWTKLILHWQAAPRGLECNLELRFVRIRDSGSLE